jgi:signal transduction histidine kinase
MDEARRYEDASPLHSLRTASAVDHLLVHCDEERLRRVVANLISNAIKYSPAGGEITLTLAEERAGGRTWAVWSVADCGIGIPHGEEEAIFDRFRRGSNVAGRIPGLGIGLAGARQILEEHGGALAVANREGGGAVFTIRLPLPSAC